MSVTSRFRGWLLAVLALFAASVAHSAVDTPSVQYPRNGDTRIWINPTIFSSVMTETPRATFTQRDAEVQISTTSAFAGGDIVWQSFVGQGGGFSIIVNEDHGTFRNAQAGKTSLAHNTTYYVRVRQQTRNPGTPFSSYSSSTHSFTTRADFPGTTYFVRTDGHDTNCNGTADTPDGSAAPNCAFLTISRAHTTAVADDIISIRAGDIILARDVPPRMSARNVIGATIEEVHILGPRVLVYADVGERLIVEITLNALRDLEVREGQRVYLVIKTNSIMVLDAPG